MQCVLVWGSTWLQARWQLSIMHMVLRHIRLAYCFPQCCSNPSNGLLLNRLELSELLISHRLDRYPLWNWYPPNKDLCMGVCVGVSMWVCVCVHSHTCFLSRPFCVIRVKQVQLICSLKLFTVWVMDGWINEGDSMLLCLLYEIFIFGWIICSEPVFLSLFLPPKTLFSLLVFYIITNTGCRHSKQTIDPSVAT